METSDSECFESADEDFISDEENTNTVKSTSADVDSKDMKEMGTKLANLKVKENKDTLTKDASATTKKEIVKLNAESRDSKTKTGTKLGEKLAKKQPEVPPLTLNVVEPEAKPPPVELSKVPVASLDSPEEVDDSLWNNSEVNWGKERNADKAVKEEENMWDESEINWGQQEPFEVEQKYMETRETASATSGKKALTIREQSDKIKKNERFLDEEVDNIWGESEINWGHGEEATFTSIQKPKEKDLKTVESGSEDSNKKTNKKYDDQWVKWDKDDWEAVKPEREPTPSLGGGWGTWGGWGVSSILNTATQGVSTLTYGISTVLESGIGVPEPEELARINKAEREKKSTAPEDSPETHERTPGFGLGNLVMGVSHLTKLVESTGTKVISGGLDTLETIGKKTMEVLQEGDPGLKKKRAFLTIEQDRPILSQLLREAKEKAEQENKLLEQKHFAKRAKNYETLFDDHQGLVHLEALEMLSKQCDIKLQNSLESLTDEALVDLQETMEQVKELCELPDEDEEEQITADEAKDKLESAVTEIDIPISYKRLIETWDETETWLNHLKLEICDERELHQQAIETLAQLTAIAVEQFHKTGELLLVKERRSTADEADSLVQLTTTLTSLIGVVAAKFSDKLNAKGSSSKNKEEINTLITNVFFEAANSSSYIQDAFQLLIPVLQVGAV